MPGAPGGGVEMAYGLFVNSSWVMSAEKSFTCVLLRLHARGTFFGPSAPQIDILKMCAFRVRRQGRHTQVCRRYEWRHPQLPRLLSEKRNTDAGETSGRKTSVLRWPAIPRNVIIISARTYEMPPAHYSIHTPARTTSKFGECSRAPSRRIPENTSRLKPAARRRAFLMSRLQIFHVLGPPEK